MSRLPIWAVVQLGLIAVLGLAVHAGHLWTAMAVLVVILIRPMPKW